MAPSSDFKEYRVFRAESSTVSDASVLVATFTNKTDTSFTDTGLTARKTYYYRVYVYDTSDTGSGSNQALAMTAGLPLGWTDGFETNQPGWTFTDTWACQADAGRNGSDALVDSPADYANSSDTYAQVGVDLTGTTWPVLKFWDRYAFADGDWGRVYISANAGASWTIAYGAAGTRTNWTEQAIDLSPWKNQAQVWIRFDVTTDGGTQNDGWHLDDLSLSENTPVASIYPFFETFENGLTNWLQAGWSTDTNQPFAGATVARSTSGARMTPETASWLGLNQELVLTNAVNPQLAFLLRGHLDSYSSFRTQVSADRGITWSDLGLFNRDYGFNAGWTRLQASLQSYTNQSIRLRFQINSFWGSAPYSELALDNVGLGELAPGAPDLSAPAQLATVTILRPTLIVNNAVDYQSDPLTYRFEVYADAGLSNLVAQVPVVASGASLTAWQVDTELPNAAQFWWRCRASDGTNTGPWMAAASFFVNQVNHPPLPVTIAGPPGGTIMSNLNDVLFWYPTTDPDAGDAVASYHIQVDDNPLFASPEISVTNLVVTAMPGQEDWAIAVALSDLAGSSNLVAGAVYHWRVCAADTYGAYSHWPAGDQTFQFGIAPPRPATLAGLRPGPNGTMSLEWQGASGQLYVEFSLSLNPANWQTIAGPLHGTNWTFTPVPGAKSGFYRVRSE